MQHGHRGVREEESVCEKGRERGAAREREREEERDHVLPQRARGGKDTFIVQSLGGERTRG